MRQRRRINLHLSFFVGSLRLWWIPNQLFMYVCTFRELEKWKREKRPREVFVVKIRSPDKGGMQRKAPPPPHLKRKTSIPHGAGGGEWCRARGRFKWRHQQGEAQAQQKHTRTQRNDQGWCTRRKRGEVQQPSGVNDRPRLGLDVVCTNEVQGSGGVRVREISRRRRRRRCGLPRCLRARPDAAASRRRGISFIPTAHNGTRPAGPKRAQTMIFLCWGSILLPSLQVHWYFVFFCNLNLSNLQFKEKKKKIIGEMQLDLLKKIDDRR